MLVLYSSQWKRKKMVMDKLLFTHSGAINFIHCHVCSILISVLLSYIIVGLRSKVDNQRACMLFPYCPQWKMQGRVLLHVFANRGLIYPYIEMRKINVLHDYTTDVSSPFVLTLIRQTSRASLSPLTSLATFSSAMSRDLSWISSRFSKVILSVLNARERLVNLFYKHR